MSNLSPTPETDLVEADDNGETYIVFELARRLERERDEARELARELQSELLAALPILDDDEQEMREKAKTRGDNWKQCHKTLKDQANDVRNLLAKAKEVLP